VNVTPSKRGFGCNAPSRKASPTPDLAQLRWAEVAKIIKRILATGALDQRFANRTVTDESLTKIVAQIGATQAELRNTHVKYHLLTAQMLSAEQMQRTRCLEVTVLNRCSIRIICNEPKRCFMELWDGLAQVFECGSAPATLLRIAVPASVPRRRERKQI